jgi:hypothetical protein
MLRDKIPEMPTGGARWRDSFRGAKGMKPQRARAPTSSWHGSCIRGCAHRATKRSRPARPHSTSETAPRKGRRSPPSRAFFPGIGRQGKLFLFSGLRAMDPRSGIRSRRCRINQFGAESGLESRMPQQGRVPRPPPVEPAASGASTRGTTERSSRSRNHERPR